MKHHKFYFPLQESDLSSECRQLKDLKDYISGDRELDALISEKFPIESFGDPNDLLLIKGSKDLLNTFDKIDAEKIDITEKLENIKHSGFDENEIILDFNGLDTIATGIYNFTYDFFEEIFDMGKYSNFCIEKNIKELIHLNSDFLLEKFKDKEMQYRLLRLNATYYLRGITSKRYKNYDNNLAIYIGFLALHKFAHDMGTSFCIERAYLTDSAISIMFRQLKPVVIKNVGEVYFGAVLKNNEIRDSTFSLEFRYTVVNGQESFSGMPDSIKDKIFDITHTSGIRKVEVYVNNIYKMNELKNVMLSYIEDISNLGKVTKEELIPLMQKILNSKNKLQTGTKNKVKDFYDRDFVANTLTIIQTLHKLTGFSSDIDEELYLEHLYHEAIIGLLKAKRE